MNTQKSKLGVALVGLGTYSKNELAPALQQADYCELVAVVSNNEEKRAQWKKQYNLKEENLYSYDDFDKIKDNTDIDIVYIVLPNNMHAEYVIKAAQAGKHVITEKPMATNVEDCQSMIQACKDAGVKLSVGYRLHFDPFNLEMMRLGQQEIHGPVRNIIAKNGMDVGDPDQWRLKAKQAGGGPLMDVGIYCVQGVIYTSGMLPIAVTAHFTDKSPDTKCNEVEEGIAWTMEFPGGATATCETSYKHEMNILRAETEAGWFELKPAFEYRGLKGQTYLGPMDLPEVNQQAQQLDDFAKCIMENRESRVPGEMGMRDVEILMAIYEAAKTGKRVELNLQPFENLIEM